MKKRRNIAAAIVLSSMMAVSTCAFAVTSMTASAGSIKINSAADTGNTYKAYQILTGTITSTDTLSNVTMGSNLSTISSDLVTALKAVDSTVFSSLSTSTTPTQFATMISNLTADEQKRSFARVIGKYVTGTGQTVDADNNTNVADGYYIVKEEGTGTPKTLNLLKVAGTVTINVKENTPSAEKKVTDTNDSKTLTDTHEKTADYDIGDDIPYTLTFTLPADYANYEKYPITFWDDMCPGLSLNTSSVTIQYGSAAATGITLSPADTTDNKISKHGGTVYKYVIPDLKAVSGANGMQANDTITISYTAKLTGDSVVIGGTGNPNTYTVQYASDPNWTSTTGPGETTPPTTPPTKETPEKKNVVFTYQLTVNKIDDDNNSLPGAHFAIYKWTDPANTATVNAASGWNQVEEITTSGISTFDFKGLDDGIYKLVETQKPDSSYNDIAPIMFEINAEHNDSTYDLGTITCTGLTGASVSDGVISVNIQNNKGMTLPTTGGIGTTLFYIIGGTLVAGSIVLLITKKRMHSTEE